LYLATQIDKTLSNQLVFEKQPQQKLNHWLLFYVNVVFESQV